MENKILIIQKAGEHIANREYRESLCIKRAFDKLGIESIVWGKGYPTYKIPFDQIVKGFNIILVVENYEFDWIPDLTKFNGLKLFWSIDGHLVLDKHKEFLKKNDFKIVLNSNLDCVGSFNDMVIESLWFPNAYDEQLMVFNPEIKKVHRIGFCGSSHDSRNEVIDKLDLKLNEFKYKVKRDILVIGDDMVNSINSYMIHFNMNIKGDINYRTFETMGCKTMLFTNATSGIDKLFDCEKELVLWNNDDDIYSKALEHISDIPKSMAIAKAGYERVNRDHTYTMRMNHLLMYIKTL